MYRPSRYLEYFRACQLSQIARNAVPAFLSCSTDLELTPESEKHAEAKVGERYAGVVKEKFYLDLTQKR